MKKILLYASALAGLFLAASCQQELNPVTEGDTTVRFTVSTGDVATRAIADGTNIDVLHWEIYGADIETAAQPLGENSIIDTDGDKTFTVELKLLADQTYNIIFWAEVNGARHYGTDDLRNVTVDYSDEKANDESRAAFFKVYNFTTENGAAINETVVLTRPFAQINLGSTTYETSFNIVNGGQVKVETSQMTVTNIATSFNTLTGKGEGQQAVTFNAAATPNGDADQTQKLLEVNDLYYYWLGMNYLVVNGDSDNVDVDVTLATNFGDVNHSVSNVPVKENYRTNLLGDFLTTGATFNVVIDERFNEPEYYGPEFVQTPAYDDATKTWTINTANELAWLAAAVNGTIPPATKAEAINFAGATIRFANDIDMEGINIEKPIRFWSPENKTTIDGQNHTISNLTMSTNSTDKQPFSLFGGTADIKNLKFDNANISGYSYVAVIAGNLYGNIDNCHVSNSTVQCAYWMAGALSGQYNAGNVTGCSVTNTTIKGPAAVGALIGVINETSGERKVENCTVTGCTIVQNGSFGGSYDTMFGSVVGLVNVNNSTIYLSGCNVVNTTVNGGSAPLYGSNGGSNTKVIIDEANVFVVNTVEELQAVLNAAPAGNNLIYVNADLSDALVTVPQKEGVNLIIDGTGNKFDGTFDIYGAARYDGEETLLFRNINFEHTDASALDFISCNTTDSAKRYAHNVTVENCSFTGNDAANVVGMRYRQCYDLAVINSTATKMHSLIQAYGCNGVAVNGVEMTESKSGISFGTSNNVTVTASEFAVTEYGLRADGSSKSDLKVVNTEISANQPIVVRKLSCEYASTFEGTNILNTTEEYQVVLTNGADDADYIAPTGAFTLAGADSFKVYPNDFEGELEVASAAAFQNAIENSDAPEVTLTDDVDLSGQTTYISKDLVLSMGEDVQLIGGGITGGDYALLVSGEYDVELNDVNILGGGINAQDGATMTFKSGSIAQKIGGGKTSRYSIYAGSSTEKQAVINIEGGDFYFAEGANPNNNYVCANGNAIVYIKGGNFGEHNPTRDYKPIVEVTLGAYTGQVIITGGTFMFDPTAWVAEGYQAVKSGNTWTVSAL